MSEGKQRVVISSDGVQAYDKEGKLIAEAVAEFNDAVKLPLEHRAAQALRVHEDNGSPYVADANDNPVMSLNAWLRAQ